MAKGEHSPTIPTPSETAALLSQGYEVDSLGRPIHPWIADGLIASDLPEGKGAYWNWGPNRTADPIVITSEEHPRILMIIRSDDTGTDTLALPGGFVDPAEQANPEIAARRELEEETGVELDEPGALVYSGIVSDPRTTANAWPETSAYLYIVKTAMPIRAGDDAKSVQWVNVDDLKRNSIYGSHRELIEQALRAIMPPCRTIEEILAVPELDRETIVINGGHMAYDHLLTRHKTDYLFMKRHDASRFNDPVREQHSRNYLQKEHSLMTHLRDQGFTHLPRRVALIGDHTLVMDAHRPEDDWHWRAPQDERFANYINDILRGLSSLQKIPVPKLPETENAVNDTFETLWREGWDDIDDEIIPEIEAKIRSFYPGWDERQQAEGEALISQIPGLRKVAQEMSRTPPLFMAHNDARQSNIAWHEAEGVVFVDWSWGGPSPKHADATMLLVDLAKSGYDVGAYLEHLNKDHLVTLIGFWLAHSLWRTRDGSLTVREHQVASSTVAWRLLERVAELSSAGQPEKLA